MSSAKNVMAINNKYFLNTEYLCKFSENKFGALFHI